MDQINMTTELSTNQHGALTVQNKVTAIGLAVLPLALAAYSNNGISIQGISSALTSGVFPIGFTLLSWGIAAKIGLKMRK
jgi:hypothetical protein